MTTVKMQEVIHWINIFDLKPSTAGDTFTTTFRSGRIKYLSICHSVDQIPTIDVDNVHNLSVTRESGVIRIKMDWVDTLSVTWKGYRDDTCNLSYLGNASASLVYSTGWDAFEVKQGIFRQDCGN